MVHRAQATARRVKSHRAAASRAGLSDKAFRRPVRGWITRAFYSVKEFVHVVNMVMEGLVPAHAARVAERQASAYEALPWQAPVGQSGSIWETAMSYQGRKVVVTGADGFIGSHVVEALVDAGADVTALALYNSFDSFGWIDDLAPSVKASVRAIRGDVRDASFVLRLLKGQDVCMHLAALIAIPHSYDAPQSYIDVNVSGTLNVLEAARAHGLSRIVHTSTSEVYGTALTTPMDEAHPLQGQSPYSASKIGADMMAEAYARSFGLPVVILRPFNTFGPRQSERAVLASTIRQAIDPACAEIKVGDLTTERDFTFVRDTAAAFLAVGAADSLAYGDTYNGGTGRAVTIGAAVEAIVRLAGSNKPVVSEAARLRPAASEVRALLADNGKLAAATGWQPGHTLEQGLEATVLWWRERIGMGRARKESGYVT
jgi:NAD dependent epimerase/dehydratase